MGCIDLIQQMMGVLRDVHPFFLATGGGASTLQFGELMKTLCAGNCALALITRLLCMREHGNRGCALVPLGIDENPNLKDGTPCPLGVFHGQDKAWYRFALAWVLKLELERNISELKYLDQYGVHLDGSSIATPDWIKDTTTNNEMFAEMGEALAPTEDTKMRLAELGKESHALFEKLKTPPAILRLPAFGKEVSPLAARTIAVRFPAIVKARRPRALKF